MYLSWKASRGNSHYFQQHSFDTHLYQLEPGLSKSPLALLFFYPAHLSWLLNRRVLLCILIFYLLILIQWILVIEKLGSYHYQKAFFYTLWKRNGISNCLQYRGPVTDKGRAWVFFSMSSGDGDFWWQDLPACHQLSQWVDEGGRQGELEGGRHPSSLLLLHLLLLLADQDDRLMVITDRSQGSSLRVTS